MPPAAPLLRRPRYSAALDSLTPYPRRPLCFYAPCTHRHIRRVFPGGLGVDLWHRTVDVVLLQRALLSDLPSAGEACLDASGFFRATLLYA